MAQFRIELSGDTDGHIQWHFHIDHNTDNNNNADVKGIASVLEKLNDFTKQLKGVNSPCEVLG